ncbi:right-handed parallel beta-helix repeat-containing protein [Candidatus Sumerlaeota bacterium]|nr:right-handed parallel beta-helix repeat-containing protein [Candidatus Sumerlaeota bacterium]
MKRTVISLIVFVMTAVSSICAAAEQNVRSFGAVGDGKADDTAAIEKAVHSGVGVVRLPKGVYRITKPVVIALDEVGYTTICGDGVARIVMDGPGPALRFVGTHAKSADPDGFSPDVWERQRMPMVDGVAIVGNHPEAVGIEASGTMQLTVTRLHARGLLHGIHLVGNNRNALISDCHIYENRGVGIYYDNVNLHQSNITGSHISYNRMGGVVSRGANVRNIHITGCDIESNMSRDTSPTANVLLDCTVSAYGTGEVAITGCTIQHNSRSTDSANIRILGASKPRRAGDVVREGNVTITGNVLSDVKVNVHLKGCRGVAVTGNTFWMGYTHNLLIEECSDIVVGPNNFDRNPRYDYGDAVLARNSLVVRKSEDCTLSGLHITNVWGEPAGLLIENCRRMNVTDCTVLDCDNGGVLLRGVSDSRVSGCLIRDDRADAKSVPLEVVGGSGNMVVGNLLGAAPRVAKNAAHVEGNVYPKIGEGKK